MLPVYSYSQPVDTAISYAKAQKWLVCTGCEKNVNRLIWWSTSSFRCEWNVVDPSYNLYLGNFMFLVVYNWIFIIG